MDFLWFLAVCCLKLSRVVYGPLIWWVGGNPLWIYGLSAHKTASTSPSVRVFWILGESTSCEDQQFPTLLQYCRIVGLHLMNGCNTSGGADNRHFPLKSQFASTWRALRSISWHPCLLNAISCAWTFQIAFSILFVKLFFNHLSM